MGDAACNAWEKHNSIAHLSCASQTGYERVDHLDLARKQAIKRVKWTDVARSRGPKGQETNFHPNISEFQVKCVSSHKCLTKLQGRESHSHLASQKCLTKLHAAKRPPLSTSRSKGTGHKFPSKYQNANSKASAHTNVSRIPSLNLSAHTNVSLSSKGRESPPHLVSHKCLIKLHAAKRPSLSTSRSKGTGNKFPSKSLECQFKSVSSHKCLTNSNQTRQLTQTSH